MRILALTGIRSDYDLMSGLYRALSTADDFELGIIVMGAHLSPTYGMSVKEIENDGLNIGILNSDGIIHYYEFIPYDDLSEAERQARIKDNKDAYNINKGLEHAKNKSYDLAELYFKCLPENYSTFMLDTINQKCKSTYDLKAEEDLTKIFRAFNIEIYTLDDLTDIEPPSLSEEQAEKLQSAINKWRSEYSQNTLNFQFSAE